MLVSEGTPMEEVAREMAENRRWRESAGQYVMIPSEARALQTRLFETRMRQEEWLRCQGVPEAEWEPVDDVQSVWALPTDHEFKVEHDAGLWTSPACVARAELTGYAEDLYLTVDGRWLHPDDRDFRMPVLPQTVRFSLSTGGPVAYPNTEVEVQVLLAEDSDVVSAACRIACLDLRPFGSEEGPGGVDIHHLYRVGPMGIGGDMERTHHVAWVSRVRGEVWRGR
jgi:hypothetical protein